MSRFWLINIVVVVIAPFLLLWVVIVTMPTTVMSLLGPSIDRTGPNALLSVSLALHTQYVTGRVAFSTHFDDDDDQNRLIRLARGGLRWRQ